MGRWGGENCLPPRLCVQEEVPPQATPSLPLQTSGALLYLDTFSLCRVPISTPVVENGSCPPFSGFCVL